MLHRLLLLLSLAAVLGIAPINYRFTGSANGSLDGNPAPKCLFVVTIPADTNDFAFQSSISTLGVLKPTGFITLCAFGTIEITAPLFVYSTASTVGFGNNIIGTSPFLYN